MTLHCNLEAEYGGRWAPNIPFIFSIGSNPSSCLSQCTTKPKQLVARRAARAIGEVVASMTAKAYSCQATANSNTSTEFIARIKGKLAGSNYEVAEATASLGYPVQLRFQVC